MKETHYCNTVKKDAILRLCGNSSVESGSSQNVIFLINYFPKIPIFVAQSQIQFTKGRFAIRKIHNNIVISCNVQF